MIVLGSFKTGDNKVSYVKCGGGGYTLGICLGALGF